MMTRLPTACLLMLPLLSCDVSSPSVSAWEASGGKNASLEASLNSCESEMKAGVSNRYFPPAGYYEMISESGKKLELTLWYQAKTGSEKSYEATVVVRQCSEAGCVKLAGVFSPKSTNDFFFDEPVKWTEADGSPVRSVQPLMQKLYFSSPSEGAHWVVTSNTGCPVFGTAACETSVEFVAEYKGNSQLPGTLMCPETLQRRVASTCIQDAGSQVVSCSDFVNETSTVKACSRNGVPMCLVTPEARQDLGIGMPSDQGGGSNGGSSSCNAATAANACGLQLLYEPSCRCEINTSSCSCSCVCAD